MTFTGPDEKSGKGIAGYYVSQRQGSGIDFNETRPFQFGDEPRHMNWRATARTGRPQVRVFQQDLMPTSYFLIDRRSTMRFGTRQRLKVAQAARLAIFLASWEARSGAELGSLIFNESIQWMQAVNGQDAIYQLAHRVSKPCPPLLDLPAIGLNQAFLLLAERLPIGSHLYLLSDFIDIKEECLPWLYQLGEQHRVWMIHIHDPAEYQLPEAGRLQLVWNQLTANTKNTVDTSDKNVQQHHKLRFKQQQLKIKYLCDRAGILFTSLSSSEDDIVKALQTGLF